MQPPHDRPGTNPRVRMTGIEVLSDNWYTLRKATFEFQGPDGAWRTEHREAYDRGNGATVLLYDPVRGTIVLTRQFRMPAFLNEHPDGMLIEAPGGLLDGDDPLTAMRRELEEETGYVVSELTQLYDVYMSPGSVTERVIFFHGTYSPHAKTAARGDPSVGELHPGVGARRGPRRPGRRPRDGRLRRAAERRWSHHSHRQPV